MQCVNVLPVLWMTSCFHIMGIIRIQTSDLRRSELCIMIRQMAPLACSPVGTLLSSIASLLAANFWHWLWRSYYCCCYSCFEVTHSVISVRLSCMTSTGLVASLELLSSLYSWLLIRLYEYFGWLTVLISYYFQFLFIWAFPELLQVWPCLPV